MPRLSEPIGLAKPSYADIGAHIREVKLWIDVLVRKPVDWVSDIVDLNLDPHQATLSS
jgi:hypothetical protein